ncbi:MAG: hypothetical protein ACP5MU_06240 [Thermoplasmata archaeon]
MTSEDLSRFSVLYGIPEDEIQDLIEEYRRERGREPRSIGDLLEVLE